MDHFWVIAAVSVCFGAVLTAVVVRRTDISRMSVEEARQLLAAMVASLSTRVQRNELIVKELSEQVQALWASQTRLKIEGEASDRERLLEYMQDWIGNVKRFVEKVDRLQRNLREMESDLDELRLKADRSERLEPKEGSGQVGLGVVSREAMLRLSPTERQVLELLGSRPMAAPEIGRAMNRSREHTARVMKSLFERGFVERETQRQPYQYRLNDNLRDVIRETTERNATVMTS